MKIINFFGGPGVGKSTLAAGLFYKMKAQGLNAELVTEYAKDVTWEKRSNLLNDQIYLLAKQNRRMARLLEHPVDYAITDSPILLCAAYCRIGNVPYNHLEPLILEVFNNYQNINVMIDRDPEFYQQVGRSQTLDEAYQIDSVVKHMLYEYGISYHTLHITKDAVTPEQVLELVIQ